MDAETKPDPLTVSVNAAPPALTVLGLIEVTTGKGLGGTVIVNVKEFDVPPPAGGVKTVTIALPALAMSAGGIAAVSCVLLPKVVGRSAPFQRTTESETKFCPVTVSVNAGPPACVLSGESAVRRGTGRAA